MKEVIIIRSDGQPVYITLTQFLAEGPSRFKKIGYENNIPKYVLKDKKNHLTLVK